MFSVPPPWVCGSRHGVFSYLVGVLGSHIGVCSSCGCFWFPGSAGGLDRVAVAAAWVFWVPAGVFGSHTGLNKGGAASGVAGAGARDVDADADAVGGGGGGAGAGDSGGAGAGVGAGARVCADDYWLVVVVVAVVVVVVVVVLLFCCVVVLLFCCCCCCRRGRCCCCCCC